MTVKDHNNLLRTALNNEYKNVKEIDEKNIGSEHKKDSCKSRYRK